MVFKKILKDISCSKETTSITIPESIGSDSDSQIEIGEFKFKGQFLDTIGTQLILDLDSSKTEIIGKTEKILSLNPIVKF